MLETHLAEFLKMKGEQRGLGYFSEQAFEGFHQEMKTEWSGANKVGDNHENLGEKLKATTVRINGKHLE